MRCRLYLLRDGHDGFEEELELSRDRRASLFGATTGDAIRAAFAKRRLYGDGRTAVQFVGSD